jgi:hypothetical protein
LKKRKKSKVKAAAAPKPVAAKVPKKENMKKQKNQPKEREKGTIYKAVKREASPNPRIANFESFSLAK